ncbi:MAG TPA: multidrug ABC transporter permease [Bacteroidales bacterium]|nr:multidrug ABC transporter permease [Bacteroidales bacterium]
MGFVIKEFYHIFRDKRTMLILFGIPVVQILLFGFVLTNELRDIRIAILDHSKDDVTREITQKLIASGFFILHSNLESSAEIQDVFRTGIVKEVVVFEQNFEQKLRSQGTASIQILADASDANTANLIVNYTTAIVNDYIQKSDFAAVVPIQIVPEVRMLYNEQLKSVYMFVPGIMTLILMLISAMMTSISIAREKEMGTMEVLLVSPLKPIHIVLGKVAPYFVLSFLNAVSILLLGYFVFDVPIVGNIFLLLAETMLFIFMALSLGILISTVAPNQLIAMMLSMVALLLPSLLLSGFIFPIENMPWILRMLSYAMPPRWFIIILKNIMLKGTGIAFIWQETLILVGFTLLFLAISVKKFKLRLE